MVHVDEVGIDATRAEQEFHHLLVRILDRYVKGGGVRNRVAAIHVHLAQPQILAHAVHAAVASARRISKILHVYCIARLHAHSQMTTNKDLFCRSLAIDRFL